MPRRSARPPLISSTSCRLYKQSCFEAPTLMIRYMYMYAYTLQYLLLHLHVHTYKCQWETVILLSDTRCTLKITINWELMHDSVWWEFFEEFNFMDWCSLPFTFCWHARSCSLCVVIVLIYGFNTLALLPAETMIFCCHTTMYVHNVMYAVGGDQRWSRWYQERARATQGT